MNWLWLCSFYGWRKEIPGKTPGCTHRSRKRKTKGYDFQSHLANTLFLLPVSQQKWHQQCLDTHSTKRMFTVCPKVFKRTLQTKTSLLCCELYPVFPRSQSASSAVRWLRDTELALHLSAYPGSKLHSVGPAASQPEGEMRVDKRISAPPAPHQFLPLLALPHARETTPHREI